MAAAPTLESIAASVSAMGERFNKFDDFFAALKKTASKSGVSPVDLVAASQQKNGGISLFNEDGRPVPQMAWQRYRRGIGMADMLSALGQMARPTIPVKRFTLEKAANFIQRELEPHTKAALAEGSGITGGYLVPPVFLAKLLELEIENEFVQPRAMVLPMVSATLEIPAPDVTTNYGSGNSPFLYGITAKWVSEGATRPESEPQFRSLMLRANELSFYAIVNNTVLADSAIVLDTFLSQIFTKAIAWKKDYSFLQSNGVGQPMGIYNAPASIKVTRAGGANTSTLALADIAQMLGKLYIGMEPSALCWVTSQSVLPYLYQLNDVANRVIFIPLSGGIQDKIDRPEGKWSFGHIEGIPVIISEKAPSISTDFDLTLVDFSQYVIGDREQIQIEVSPHVNFLQNQIVYRMVLRIDGQPWLNQAITLANGSTVSFCVGLH
jgi:HK97 family phage major capsid protein